MFELLDRVVERPSDGKTVRLKKWTFAVRL
jgi:hypothetical protein